MLVLAAPASAADICATYGFNSLHEDCDPSGDTFAAGFNDAVDQANGNPGFDRILIGPGTYPPEGTHVTADAAQDLVIDGSGRDATFMQVAGDGERLVVVHDPETVVSDLEIQLAVDPNLVGIEMNGGELERIDVTGAPLDGSTGILALEGVDADDVRVDLTSPQTETVDGLHLADNGSAMSVLSDIEARAPTYALSIENGTVDLERGHLRGGSSGIEFRGAGAFSGESFVARGTHGNSVALGIHNFGTADADTHVDVRHATLYVHENGPALDVRQFAGRVIDVDVADTAISGAGEIDLHASTVNADSEVDVELNYSSWSPSQQEVDGTATITSGEGNLNGPGPRYVNIGGGDFRLRGDSPFVDAGTPGDLGDESRTDYLRGDRLLDGDGDGTERRDIGAEEFDPADDPEGDGDGDTGGGADDGGGAAPPPVQPPVGPPGDPQVFPPPPAALQPLSVRRGNRRVDRRGRALLVIGCPAAAPGPCVGAVVLRAAGRRLGRRAFTIAPGRTARVRVNVGRRGRRALRRARRLRVRAIVTAANALPVRRTFTLRRARRALG
jgi:hypothetical protein